MFPLRSLDNTFLDSALWAKGLKDKDIALVPRIFSALERLILLGIIVDGLTKIIDFN